MQISVEAVVDFLLSEIESKFPERIRNRPIPPPQIPVQPPRFEQYSFPQNSLRHMHYPPATQIPLVMTEQYPGSMYAQPVQPVPAGNGTLSINEPQNPGPAFTPRSPGAPHLPPSPMANIRRPSIFGTPQPQPHPAPLYRGDPRNGGPPAGYDPVFHRFQSF